MKHALGAFFFPALRSCAASGTAARSSGDLIGIDSFALAARYGMPASYQHLGEYLQLNYGNATVGCQVIVPITPKQRAACRAAKVRRRYIMHESADEERGARAAQSERLTKPMMTEGGRALIYLERSTKK